MQLDNTNDKMSVWSEIRSLIISSKQNVAIAVNAELTLLYWKIGEKLLREVLHNERATYGNTTIKTLANQLTQEFGQGFGEKVLRHCIQFAEVFPNVEIVSTVSRQLSWSHFLEIIYLPNDLQRQFYLKMSEIERWSVRRLRERKESMLFERTAISRKPEELIQQEFNNLSSDSYPINPDLIFKETYILDFLGLKDTFSERDLEDAILQNLQHFLIELGSDFAFMGRQRRITIDGDDYVIDLLFYHRRMKRLVIIDLKLRKFKAADKGQMELYLRWFQKYEQLEDELPPIGLILCSDASGEHVELMLLDEENIKVAQYLTILPPREILKSQLHRAIEIARNRIP